MLTLLKRRLNAPLWADQSFSSNTSGTSASKAKLGLGVVVAVGTLCASLHGAAAAPPLVGTQEGIVRGFVTNGVAEFLGIPYAEPPVGNLRWKPSKKHEPWAGVLKSTA